MRGKYRHCGVPGPPDAPDAPEPMELNVDVEVAQATANAIASADVLVRRHQHPLNHGRSPQHALLGLQGGRYSPHDHVGIVLDSIRLFKVRSHSRLSLSEDDKAAAKRRRESEEKLKGQLTFTANCACVAKNPKLLVPSADGDAMVCSSCGTVGEKITVSQTRQKQCASEEDKTQVADAPSEVATALIGRRRACRSRGSSRRTTASKCSAPSRRRIVACWGGRRKNAPASRSGRTSSVASSPPKTRIVSSTCSGAWRSSSRYSNRCRTT